MIRSKVSASLCLVVVALVAFVQPLTAKAVSDDCEATFNVSFSDDGKSVNVQSFN